MQTYGTGFFKIRVNSDPPFLTGQELDYELDLSDIEVDTVETIALDGTRWEKIKGYYLNPKLTIHMPSTDIQTILNEKVGQIVSFTPFDDNPQMTDSYTLVSTVPIFQSNTAVIIDIEITLRSVGYVKFLSI